MEPKLVMQTLQVAYPGVSQLLIEGENPVDAPTDELRHLLAYCANTVCFLATGRPYYPTEMVSTGERMVPMVTSDNDPLASEVTAPAFGALLLVEAWSSIGQLEGATLDVRRDIEGWRAMGKELGSGEVLKEIHFLPSLLAQVGESLKMAAAAPIEDALTLHPEALAHGLSASNVSQGATP